MNILCLLKDRRSVRKFKKRCVSKKMIGNILEAARWAPSGLNNQPWKFMILSKVKKDALAKYTRYSYIITSCDKLILVFLDKKASYDFEKDLMATGAAIQNMLLYVHSKNLGACWLGEILNQKKQVHRSLKIDKNLELKAAIALGYPQKRPASGKRKSLKGLLVR